jgi:ankyrin repeat protein
VAEIFAKANVQIAPENGYATAFNTNENQLAFYDYILFSATSLSLDNRPALIWPNPDPKSLWNSLLTHGMYQETGRAWFSDHAMVQATFYFKDILDAREAAGAAAKAAAAGAPGGPGFPPVGSAGAVGGLPAPGPAAYAALFNAINTGNEAAAIGLLRQNSQLMHIKQGASSPLRLAIEKGLENVVKVLLDLQALQYEDASLIRDLAEKIKNEKASTPLAALAQKIYDMIPKPLTGPVSPSPAPLAGAAAAVLSVREPARPAPHATGPVVPIAAIPAGASPAPLTGIQSKAVANAREIDEYFAAVKKDDQDTVTKMLKKYPDLIQIIRDGTTSLQEAIKYGQETIVEQLLKLGALTYEQDRRTILDVARTARDRNQGDPGEYAVALRILEDIERALGERSSAVAGAPPARPAPIPAKAPVTLPSPVAASAALPEPSASDVVALFDAIARDDADTVERLIKTNSRLWDSQNATGKLPEAVVITGSKRNVFDRLMNMNLIGQDKSLIHGTALAMDVNNSDASRYIDRRVREHLGLLAAATPTAAVPAPAARPALGAPAVAIAPAGPVPVAAPLTRPGAASAQELLFKAVQDNDIEAVKKIIKANPSLVNSKNEANVTPLMIAITNGKNEMVAALVKDGGTDWGITGGPKNVSIEALAEQMAKLYPENEGAQKINALIKLFTASAPGAVPAAVPVTAVRPSAPLLVLPSADTSRTGLVVPSFGAMSHAIASGNVHEVRKILQEKPEETRSNLEIFIKEAQRAETENKKVATNYQEIIALLNTR